MVPCDCVSRMNKNDQKPALGDRGKLSVKKKSSSTKSLFIAGILLLGAFLAYQALKNPTTPASSTSPNTAQADTSASPGPKVNLAAIQPKTSSAAGVPLAAEASPPASGSTEVARKLIET